jgi:hypothetical protein
MSKGYSLTPEESYRKRSQSLLGHEVSKETRLKMSQAKKGKSLSTEHKLKLKGRIPWNKGKKGLQKHDEKFIENLRKRMLGNKFTLGYKHTVENRKKFGNSGMNHPNWKGGLTDINLRQRKTLEYNLWKMSVFKRDYYLCQKCREKSGYLNAHHIQNFADYKELRTSIENGITLCKKCHQFFHIKYGRKRNTRDQLLEYLKNNK